MREQSCTLVRKEGVVAAVYTIPGPRNAAD